MLLEALVNSVSVGVQFGLQGDDFTDISSFVKLLLKIFLYV